MLTGWTAAGMPDQHGRTTLVTGANSGIGFHQALELARKGAHVLLASRDPGRGQAARAAIMSELPAASVELDLTDLVSVQRLPDQLPGRGPWTGPKQVGGLPAEGTWRAHQVPLPAARSDPEQLAQLEAWMRSYQPGELFGADGVLVGQQRHWRRARRRHGLGRLMR